MSTRSIIAEPHGDAWRGRYCHSDGYPTWNGRVLWALVQRDGLEQVRQTLLHDHAGWSSLDPNTPDLTGVTPDPDAAWDTPEKQAAVWNLMYADGRFKRVIGMGVAYTTTKLTVMGQKDYQQVREDDWIDAHGDKGGTEWCYVLAEGGLMVGKVGFGRGVSDPVNFVGMYRWNDPEPSWKEIK